MEKIVMDYPYASVNVDTNKNISLNRDIGYEYSRVQKSIPNGKRVENIGQSILMYDKIWAAIK